jgi:hypothetical protein
VGYLAEKKQNKKSFDNSPLKAKIDTRQHTPLGAGNLGGENGGRELEVVPG